MKTARFVLSCHSVGTSLPVIALSAWMSASSFAGSPRCAFTLTRNVAAPAAVLFRRSSIASNKMSASGDTPEWTFQQIDFVAARRDAVAEDDICNKLERLIIHARKRDQIPVAHVLRICEARDTVFRSYYQQVHRSSGADTTISIQKLREQVDV